MATHFAALVIIIPLLAALFVPVIGWWKKGLCHPLVVAVLVVPLISSLGILNRVIESGPFSYHLGGWAPPWGIEYAIDYLNAFVLVIISVISLIVSVYSKKSVEKEMPEKVVPFYTLFLLLVTGLFGIVATGDLFNVFVFLEVASFRMWSTAPVRPDLFASPIPKAMYPICATTE